MGTKNGKLSVNEKFKISIFVPDLSLKFFFNNLGAAFGTRYYLRKIKVVTKYDEIRSLPIVS
jgi:hypothetical protein